MKSVFFCAALLVVSFAASAQYVHKIKADSIKLTNDSCNAELILENSTKHIPGFLYNKGNGRTEFRPAVTRLPGGAYLIGGDTVRLGQDAILNQYAQKQTASAWIDSIKAKIFYIDSHAEAFNNINLKQGLAINPSYKNTLRIVDTYHNLGLNNPSENYGAPGSMVELLSNADTLKNFRRSVVLNVNKSLEDSGMAIWGNGKYYMEKAAQIRVHFRPWVYGSTPYTLYSNFDFAHAALQSRMDFGWKGNATLQDTMVLTTGTGASSPFNHFMRNDLWSGGSPRYRHTGWFVSSAVGWDYPENNGSVYGSFIDYYAGIVRGNAANVEAKYLFYGEDIGYNWINRPWGLFIKGSGKTKNYLQAPLLIGDSSVLNADMHKLYVSGSSKFAGNLVQSTGRTLLGGAIDDGVTPLQLATNGALKVTADYNHIVLKGSTGSSYPTVKMIDNTEATIASNYYNVAYSRWGFNQYRPNGIITMDINGSAKLSVSADRITITNALNLTASTPPTSSADPSGMDGDLKRDAAGNIYLKANGQWLKFIGTTF